MDHACKDNLPIFGTNRWLVLSSEGCPNSWGSDSRPASKCPQAFVEIMEAIQSLTFYRLLSDLNLVDRLKGLTAQTIFEPSDKAFAKLPEGTLESWTTKQKKEIVSRHIVEGAIILAANVTSGPVKTFDEEVIDLIKTDKGGVQISYKNNLINVVTADVIASNGVVHVIDEVILPAETPELGDVVEVAVANGNFKILVEVLTDLDLVDRLKGLSAQTIFAPSDEAISKLPEGTLDRLTDKQKRKIVLRHVVEGATILAANVKSGPITTMGGEVIRLKNYNEPQYGEIFHYDEAEVQISYKNNVINVVTLDFMASNGVIHVIDKVILPSKFLTFNITYIFSKINTYKFKIFKSFPHSLT